MVAKLPVAATSKPECKKLAFVSHNRKFNDMSLNDHQLSHQSLPCFLNGIIINTGRISFQSMNSCLKLQGFF